MRTPTREDLQRLLFSDPASDAFEQDARGELARKRAHERPTDRVRKLIEMVGVELNPEKLAYEYDFADEHLRDLACTAKRGAILLLHAAWAAEQALAALEQPTTCPTCGATIDFTPVTAWVGTPPPGWKPGGPTPHVCSPLGLWVSDSQLKIGGT